MTDLNTILAEAGIETRPTGTPNWQPRPREKAPEGEGGMGTFFSTAIEQDWAHAAIGRIYEDSGHEFDPNFDFKRDVDDATWQAWTKDIPEEFHENLGNARSLAHAEYLAGRLRESVEREKTLSEYGAWGVGGRFATALVDPSAWLLAIGSGGGSFAVKSERLLNAAKSARAAGSLKAARTSLQAAEGALPGSATGYVLKGGAVAGAENTGLELILAGGDDTKDEWDVAFAGLSGFTIGSGINKLLSGREMRAFQTAATKEKRLLELAELDARQADLRKDIVGSLKVSPEEARASIQKLDEEVGAFRSRYEAPVVGAYSPEYRRALESGSMEGAANAKNKNSSATGADQFVSSTWLGVVAQHAPELFPKGVTLKQAKQSIKNGRSSIPEVQALLDKRTDKALSGRMAEAFDGDNQRALEKAGAPVDRHTMYAMHHFGPGAGVKFAKASDDTPMANLISEGQLKANEYLRGKTKGEARASWDKRAAKAGVELNDGVRLADDAPAVKDPSRGLDVDNLDEDAINARLAEIEEQMGRPIDDVLADAANAPKRSELARLGREVEDLEKRLKKLDGEEARVEARMLAEDQVSLGLTEAAAKQRAKMRRKAAQEEARVARRNLEEPLNRARAEHQRLTAADIARAEARRIERQGPKLASERDRLVEALGLRQKVAAAAPTRKALEQLDAIDNVRSNVEAVTQNIATGKGADTLDKETLSAAKSVGVVDDITELLSPKSGEMPRQARMQFASATKLIGGTFSGVLRGHTNEKIRSTLGRMVGNSIGNEDGSAVAVGASEIQARLSESMGAKFHSVATPAYREWADRKGYGLLDRQTRKVRDEFMQDVGRTIRGEIADPDPAVQKLAARVSELFKDFLREAQEAGVKGFENVEDNPNYLPRVFDFHRLENIEKEVGTSGINDLIRGAIKAANEDMDDDLADKLAKAYVKKLRQMRVGSDAGALQGVRWDDVGFLRQFLTDSGLGSDEIEDVVTRFASLNAQRNRQQEGSLRYAKRRTNLDETYSVEIPAVVDGIKTMKVVRVSDLFENNVESLFQRYTRSVSGHIGLAKVGIKSRADFEQMIREAENELGGDVNDLENVKEYAETAYKLITGQPIENAHALHRIGRTIRDWNFATTMNQAGFAQIPDMASLLSKGYLRYTLGNLGYAISAMRRTDGTLDDAFARELEEWLGVGTDYHNNAVFSAYDHSETDFDRGVSTIGHTARVLGRGTQAVSGMAFITSMTQRLAAKAIVMRLVDEVTKGGRFSARRLADLGLDEGMGKRIAAQLKKHSTLLDNEADMKTRVINWQGWDDLEARDSMLNAVFREARRLVQEEDLGDTAKWMHSSWGKVLAQFRRFGLVAYTKQTLHGIAHQDAETYTRAIISMGLAAIAYKARWELKLASMEAGGADEEELEKLREDKLSHERMWAASYANSSYASISPAAIDSLAFFTTGERLFDTRTSGLGSDILTGNPTYRTIAGVGAAAKTVWDATMRDDRNITESKTRVMRAVAPYQNVIGMDIAFTALTADLPDKDEDDNPDELDWVFN